MPVDIGEVRRAALAGDSQAAGLANYFQGGRIVQLGRARRMSIVSLTALIAILSSYSQADQGPYRISASTADCLLANEAAYSSSTNSVIFVYADLCPTINPSIEERSRLAQNGPRIRQNATSSIIVLRRAEVRCFFRELRSARRSNPNATQLAISNSGCQ